jgi:nucleoside phosphorylase
MASRTLAELRGTVDFGIITILQDEYQAILKRFPGENNTEGERHYRISDVPAGNLGEIIRVAIVRCNEQGLGEAQSAASDLIANLDPRCLLAVGIAGGIPDYDFSLGDVVAATYIHDFSLEAVKKKGSEYHLGGGPVQKDLRNLLVSLPSHEQALGDWMSDPYMPASVPPVAFQDETKYYGPEVWKKTVKGSLEANFGGRLPRRPLKVVDGPVASSSRLIKNVDFTLRLLTSLRKTKAVEMEIAGVYRACQKAKGKDYPVTTIRGISDIIGFERDNAWTQYACHSVAAFTYAFVKSGLFIAPQRVSDKGGWASTSPSLEEQEMLETLRQSISGILKLVESTRILLSGKVSVKNCDDAGKNIQRIKAELAKIPGILNSGDAVPESLLPFHDSFLLNFGLPKDPLFPALIQNIEGLRVVLGQHEEAEKRATIGEWLGLLAQKIETVEQHFK